MKYPHAQKEAAARYNKKAYDRIDLIVKKGQRQVSKDFAASQGKSLNRYILDAVEADLERLITFSPAVQHFFAHIFATNQHIRLRPVLSISAPA